MFFYVSRTGHRAIKDSCINSNIATESQDALEQWFECYLACTPQVKTTIITLQLKQVGFYVVSSAGEVLESTHINIVVGQCISARYNNHLFLQGLGHRPVLFQSGLQSHRVKSK